MRLLKNLWWLISRDLADEWGWVMASVEQFDSAIAAINAAVVDVAEEVAALKEIIAGMSGAGISEAQEAQVLASLSEIEARLRFIAAPEPPPVEG